jgi:hypothetical protein
MPKFNIAQAITSANEYLVAGNIPAIDPNNVEIYRQDNFTVLRLSSLEEDTLGGYVGYGITKRNPTDKANQSLGTKLAFSRAVKNYVRAVRADQKRTHIQLGHITLHPPTNGVGYALATA